MTVQLVLLSLMTMLTFQRYTEDAFDINVGSLAGGLTVEGTADMVALNIVAGDMGPITAGEGIGSNDAGVNVTAGNLGLVRADGNINLDITVDEGYTFAGILNTDGNYTGSFNVEGSVTTILLTGTFTDNLGEYDTDDVTGFFNVNDDFAIEGVSSLDTLTVTGADTLATLDGTALTIEGSLLGSTVTVDESEGNVATTVTVDGDLAGAVTLTGDIDDPGAVTTLTVDEGDLTGTFTAQDNMTNLVVQGDWSGTVTLANSNSYEQDAPNVTNIVVWGDVSSAVLTGATYTNAVDFEGDPLAATTVTYTGGDDPVQVGGSTQYLYMTNSNVDAEYSVLFSQINAMELTGKGSTKIVSIESAAAPEVSDMNAAAKYGKKMIKGRETANDYIDFDEPGDADLPMITVGPRIQVKSLVVDGDLGGFTDVDSNLKNIFVSGDSGAIVAGKSLINGYFGGDVAQLTALKTMKNIHVEGDITDISATKMTSIDVEGDCDNIGAYKINKMFVAGDVDDIFMSGGGKWAGKIKSSYLADTMGAWTTNFDYVGENSTNDLYNPVKIINSFVGQIA